MKNIILISSTLCAIAMIWFINMGTKRINQSQEDAMKPANEWLDEINQQQRDQMAAEAAREEAKLLFSERMMDLSLKQESITTDLVKEFTAASQNRPGADVLGPDPANVDPTGLTLLNDLIRRQTEIIHEFDRLRIDLTEHLQGIADSRHIKALDDIVASKAINHLKDIKTKLSGNHSFKAAESSKVWAEKMKEWSVQLQRD